MTRVVDIGDSVIQTYRWLLAGTIAWLATEPEKVVVSSEYYVYFMFFFLIVAVFVDASVQILVGKAEAKFGKWTQVIEN
jgi:hypothetical protein